MILNTVANANDLQTKTNTAIPKPCVIILRGPPGSGKTSVSLVLREKLVPAARVNIDMLRYMVSPRDLSPHLLRAIKVNSGHIAGNFAKNGISSIIDSVFESKEIVDELCEVLKSYGYSPYVFTLVLDRDTLINRNLQREIFYRTDPERVKEILKNYNWHIGHQIHVQDKEIEEVAEDIYMHLEVMLKDGTGTYDNS